jgi:hypothetical protein
MATVLGGRLNDATALERISIHPALPVHVVNVQAPGKYSAICTFGHFERRLSAAQEPAADFRRSGRRVCRSYGMHLSGLMGDESIVRLPVASDASAV